MPRPRRSSRRLWHLLAFASLLISLLQPLQVAQARSLSPADTAGSAATAATAFAPVPAGSPALIAALSGTGSVGPDGIATLLVALNAGTGEALATLEASVSGADGQWQTLATLATPGPLTLATGFNVTLPAFGGSATAGGRTIHLRVSDASGNRSSAALPVTYDPALPNFGDVPGNLPAAEAEAIRQMAARGIIKGYANGDFGPQDTTQRAQMAALIARAMGWDQEDWGNSFSDRGGLVEALWRNVGTLQHYQVALGYDGTACAQRNTAAPCFGPTEPVTQAQTISFITRAMVKKGYWQQQANAANPFPDVPQSSGHVADLATFVHYVGAPPGATVGQNWPAWSSPATRGWFAQTEWAVVRWIEAPQQWATLPQPPLGAHPRDHFVGHQRQHQRQGTQGRRYGDDRRLVDRAGAAGDRRGDGRDRNLPRRQRRVRRGQRRRRLGRVPVGDHRRDGRAARDGGHHFHPPGRDPRRAGDARRLRGHRLALAVAQPER